MSLCLEGNPADLCRELACEGMPAMPGVKRQVLDYQMMALYRLARPFNHAHARILEIGTGHGGSAYMLAKAAPLAEVLSLTTSDAEAAAAARYWASQGFGNVEVRVVCSWDLLARKDHRKWDMVWVDGDHNRIARDMPWFNRLRAGGLLLCHDYSPQDSRSPSGIAYAELNVMAEKLGRPFDVSIIDDGKVGMAGFYRRVGEVLA